MRVVSMVPSLTETLLACGVNVVGRTRYCIHPIERISTVSIVGGTKDVHWDKVAALVPDLVILDREENTREMADACPIEWYATHITSIHNIGDELRGLAIRLQNQSLGRLADQWTALAGESRSDFRGWQSLPGLITTIGSIPDEVRGIEYMIWKDPWMGISRETFIGSMLDQIGLGGLLPHHQTSYPELMEPIPDPDTFYLFSSEPYPFERHINALESAGFNGVLVDGEFYSWFGIRSYNQLKHYLENGA